MVTFSSFRVFFVLSLGSSEDAAAAAMINFSRIGTLLASLSKGRETRRSRGDINSNGIVPVTQRRSRSGGCDWLGFHACQLSTLEQGLWWLCRM